MLDVLGGVFATAAAGLMMLLLRATLQLRSIPERLLEWLLLFVPPAQLEAGLQRFGFDAKRYALGAVILVTLAVLAALGVTALARLWPVRVLLALGPGLWLLLMLVILPLTGAGVFATEIVGSPLSASFGYLAVCLVYAGGLAAARSLAADRSDQTARAPAESRRAALVGIGGGLGALLATYALQLVRSPARLTPIQVLGAEDRPPGSVIDPATHPELVNSTPSASDRATPATSAQPSAAVALPEPRPARPLKRDKDGAVLPSGRRMGELTDLITSNDDFYVVTKNAAGDPVIGARDWRLRIEGEVAQPIELDYASLRKLGAVELTKTLECISNFAAHCELAPYGCDLISTAGWKGVRVADLLSLAGGPKPEATYLTVVSADEYTSALPLELALSPETLLAYEMNGEVLPREHGYPARLLVPGRYGLKDAKWVVALRLQRREAVDWYGQRNWSKDAVVRTMSRIDLPPAGASLPAGDYNIAGVAYGGDRGVANVEFSVDGGETWEAAEFIEPPVGRDVWARWIGRFTLPPAAQLTLRSRVTDRTGAVQREEFSLPQPDGSNGWPSIEVRAQAS
jgi:DMSO/TMAO reductase YedYZ molybdopterin-dependent catalytic subunit